MSTEPKANAWNWGGTDMTPRRTPADTFGPAGGFFGGPATNTTNPIRHAQDLSPAEAAFLDRPHEPEGLRWRIAKALNVEGAWCGVCDFEGGIEGCSECRKTLLGYADAALEVITEPVQ